MLYETEMDRINEGLVLDFLKGRFGETEIERFDKAYPIDARATGEVDALIEVKCRKFEMGKYSTVMVSAKKIDFGLAEAEKLGSTFLLAVRWTDALGVLDVREATETGEIGREMTLRRDRNVWSLNCFFPISHFTFFNVDNMANLVHKVPNNSGNEYAAQALST